MLSSSVCIRTFLWTEKTLKVVAGRSYSESMNLAYCRNKCQPRLCSHEYALRLTAEMTEFKLKSKCFHFTSAVVNRTVSFHFKLKSKLLSRSNLQSKSFAVLRKWTDVYSFIVFCECKYTRFLVISDFCRA